MDILGGVLLFKQPGRLLRATVFSIILLGALGTPSTAGPLQVPPVSPEPAAFREFTKRVQEYLNLRKSAPPLRPTKKREEIVERRRALAQRIREARSDAKPGDVFGPEISEEFRRIIQNTFQAPNVRKTIRQGEPVPGWHLSVNSEYPEKLPLTTVPPTLLLRLPQLPAGVAYRIVGHDFVLEDTDARLIVDFIPSVIP
jgi:hypothetical protein